MSEPGLDRHEWETRWSALEEQAREDPAAALVEMRNAVRQLLSDEGYALTDPVAAGTVEPEVVKQFAAAREVADLADAGNADPGDVAAAIEDFRAIYELLVSERQAP